MRICLVTPEYRGVTPESGGIGTQFAGLAHEFAERGHDVHVVTLGVGSERDEGGPARHLIPPAQPGLLQRVRDAGGADRCVRELGHFDVVLAPEWAGMAGRFALRRSRAPLVTNLATSSAQVLALSSDAPRRAAIDPRVVIPRILERVQARQSNEIVACSSAVLEWTRALWPIDGVPQEVVPNGIDLDAVRAFASGPLPAGLPPVDGPVVAVPGRLEPRKGSHVLAQALPIVAQEVPDVRLVLLGKDGRWGDTPMSAHMRRLAGSDADRMTFMGHQPEEALFPVLAQAAVLAMPSLWEAFGLVALEGMALGRPIVVTTGSGFDEFCRDSDNCLAIAPDDPVALAEALVRVLTSRALAERLGRAARTTAEGFAIGVVAERLLEVFGRVDDRP